MQARLALLSLALLTAACGAGAPDAPDVDDASITSDGPAADGVHADATPDADAARADATPPDGATSPDATPPDGATSPDAASSPDAADLVTLTVRLDGPGQGAIAVGGETCTSVCTYTLPRGAAVTLDASVTVGPFHGWWGGACDTSTATTCAVVLDADTTARAVAGEGALLWLRPLDTTGGRRIDDLAPAGERAYLTGSFGGTLTFGAETLTGGGWLVAAVDGIHGAPAWARRFVGTGLGEAVVAADDGGVVAATRWTGTLDLGAGPLEPVGESASAIAALGADGVVAWTHAIRPTVAGGMAWVLDVAVREDTVVVVGIFWPSVDLIGVTATSLGANGNDAFVIALDRATGDVRWRKVVSATGHNDAEAVTVLEGGDVVVAGQHVAPIDLGGGPVRAGTQEDAWLVRLDGDTGAHVWSRSLGTAGEEYGKGLTAAPDDTFVLSLQIEPTAVGAVLDLGGGVTATATALLGSVVSRWTEAGEPAWATFAAHSFGRRGLAAPGARVWLSETWPLVVGVDLGGAIAVERLPASPAYLYLDVVAPVAGALLASGRGFNAHDLDGLVSSTPPGGFLARLGVSSP